MLEENQTLSYNLAAKSREFHDADIRVKVLQNELTATQASMKSAKAMLDTRSTELREAREFLGTVDDVPDSEVLTLVELLNSQIYQTAASIANSSDIRESLQMHPVGGDALSHAQYQLTSSGLLTENLLVALRGFNHSQDTLVIQTALQAIMVGYLCWACNSWDLEIDSQLKEIYASIRATEPQSVAGKWRALTTRKYAIQSRVRVEERRQKSCIDLTCFIVDALLLCGMSGTHDTIFDTIVARFGHSVLGMLELALEIKETISERITSRDLLVTSAKPEEIFDAARMDDEWSDPKATSSAEGIVMCSTQLGLIKWRTENAVGGARSSELVILLKPKVVMCSLLDDLRKEHVQISGLPVKGLRSSE
ncbi:hypothetical protein C8Q70DRAFT_922319 [Cubamyces menziesii]|nr:hypothetical protein C8Q70DRAFT_922319 [Cubamyces menziesii]